MRFGFLSFVLIISLVMSMVGCASSGDGSNPIEESQAVDLTEVSGAKWVCKEADILFYTLDFGSNAIVGKYAKDGKEFRLVGRLNSFGTLDFGLYDAESQVTTTTPAAIGFIYSTVVYENDTMICSITGVDGIEFGATTLTFEKSDLRKTVKESFKCNEVGMTMSSFNEIDGYYKGEIDINGKTCGFMAFEVCGGLYRFHVENRNLNDMTEGVSPLIDMFLSEDNGQLKGSVRNSTIEDHASFPYWNFEKTELTFEKQ